MLQAVNLQSATLDLPTLSLVAICIAGLLGLFLIIDWMQQRNVRALAWWGSAYLIGASAMALGTMPTPVIQLRPIVPGALTFLACGMIWNGVRLFQGRRVLPFATFIGAALLVELVRFRSLDDDGRGPVLGALIVPLYTVLHRESNFGGNGAGRAYSRAAAIVVPCLHAESFCAARHARSCLQGMIQLADGLHS